MSNLCLNISLQMSKNILLTVVGFLLLNAVFQTNKMHWALKKIYQDGETNLEKFSTLLKSHEMVDSLAHLKGHVAAFEKLNPERKLIG
jgi:hypothetical protein